MKNIIIVSMLVLGFTGLAFADKGVKGTETYQYENNCALGVSINKSVVCDPSFSAETTWTDPATGKHYCFANPSNKATFAKNTTESMKKAEANWPTLHASLLEEGHTH